MSNNPASGARARATAARVLGSLLARHGSLGNLLRSDTPKKTTDSTESALVQEICYGVCRHFFALRFLVDQRLEKPLRNKDRDVYGLLLAGAYQIHCMRVPDHAAVNETVQAARLLKKPWAGSLVNGVLRRILKNRVDWQTLAQSPLEEVRWQHPQWFIRQLQSDWPDHWSKILAANNQRPPMTLRVNAQKTSRDRYLALLAEADRGAHRGSLASTAVYLDQPCPVDRLPGFDDGLVSVQDEASQLVPGLLDLGPGMNVLDACAAPGGKTCHCLETEPSLSGLTALDIDSSRVESIRQNLERLGLEARVTVADATNLQNWWNGTAFDRILLDAPCSATGVIRRHPDIKILRTPEEIAGLLDRQQQLLNALWPSLAPEGLLLYTTCSVLKQENELAVSRFLDAHQDAKIQAIAADWGVECRFGRQLLPENGASDGFFYALLRKTATPEASTDRARTG